MRDGAGRVGRLAAALVVAGGMVAAALAGPSASDALGQARIQQLAPPRVLDLVRRVSDTRDTVSRIESTRELRLRLDADVLFEFNKARLTPRARRAVADAADTIEREARGRVRVEGHTDAKGKPSLNRRLSMRRAEAVRRALAAQVRSRRVRFAIRGLGETQPVAPNMTESGDDNPRGRRRNRRVEVSFAR